MSMHDEGFRDPVSMSDPVPPLGDLDTRLPIPRERLRADTRVVTVDFRSGEEVIRHPQLKEMLNEGWTVESAVPHSEDANELKLLVVLRQSAAREANSNKSTSGPFAG